GGLGVLAVDRLGEVGGVTAALSPPAKQRLHSALPPTWAGGKPPHPTSAAAGAPSAGGQGRALSRAPPSPSPGTSPRSAPSSAPARTLAATVTRVVAASRENRKPASPVLPVWVGAGPETAKTFDAAGIPNFATEDDAVRGFMHLVKHREVVETLPAVPPSLPA